MDSSQLVRPLSGSKYYLDDLADDHFEVVNNQLVVKAAASKSGSNFDSNKDGYLNTEEELNLKKIK